MKMFRYAVLTLALAGSAAAAQKTTKPATAAKKPTNPAGATEQAITVYRTAACGCCGKWVDHLKTSGFAPTVHMVETMEATPVRKRLPESLRSCHTATLEGYIVEGHVPADVIRQLLRDRPRVEGIAVPGMPAGSPGMESNTPQRYDVLAFDAAGKTSVFAKR